MAKIRKSGKMEIKLTPKSVQILTAITNFEHLNTDQHKALSGIMQAIKLEFPVQVRSNAEYDYAVAIRDAYNYSPEREGIRLGYQAKINQLDTEIRRLRDEEQKQEELELLNRLKNAGITNFVPRHGYISSLADIKAEEKRDARFNKPYIETDAGRKFKQEQQAHNLEYQAKENERRKVRLEQTREFFERTKSEFSGI